MESICICGPTPTYIGPWKARNDALVLPSNVHWATGQVVSGKGAIWHRRFMVDAGVPYIMLDRRLWEWVAYDARGGQLTEIGRWPDTRPYPYPEHVRVQAREHQLLRSEMMGNAVPR
jgi:hypothetical protein